MGTVVTMQVVGDGGGQHGDRQDAIDRAFGWFHEVERRCSRFDPGSEVSRLVRSVGVPVPVSDLVFEALRFALALARDTRGAFDPAVGALMESHGFSRNARTGVLAAPGNRDTPAATHAALALDEAQRTVTVHAPLVLDLNAVVKGMAIDLAARELLPFRDFAIDAGGDGFFSGVNQRGERWSVGIRHPRDPGAVLRVLGVSGLAVCTSGDYERPAPEGHGHHLMDPRTGESARLLASATVLAPSAMVADALSTAAFVLGPVEGLDLLERHGVEGLLITPRLASLATAGFPDA